METLLEINLEDHQPTMISGTQKPTIEVCLSPALLHTYSITNKIVIVIDVFRATSTICAALHNGLKSIIPVSSISDCLTYEGNPGYLLAAERDAKLPEGFTYGNSPFHYINNPEIVNKTLVLTTTNGTKLIQMVKGAEEVLIGSFPNINVLSSYLISQNKSILLACAAWKDRVNIEDSLFAGGIVHRLKNQFHLGCDSSKIMEQIYSTAKLDLKKYIQSAHHYNRLLNLGVPEDIDYCISENIAPVIPSFINNHIIIKKV
jgi:2-phosphosulfolactate phosphatase